jgi:hypothetical protein
MNIFFLSLIPTEIAEMSCDQHVVKIQLEICQMLYTAWFFSNQQDYIEENAPFTKDGKRRGYRPAHPKHPMTMWVGSSLKNYIYACEIGIALTLEYTRRYGKVHTCAEHLMWLRNHNPSHFEETQAAPRRTTQRKEFPSVCLNSTDVRVLLMPIKCTT